MNTIHCIVVLLISIQHVHNFPALISETTTLSNGNDTNATGELYVIRAVVYEVGILTDEDNSTDESEESHEEVDLTFYDPRINGSLIDLSNIPLPVQTNVSGKLITGVAPVNLGTLNLSRNNFGSIPVKLVERDSVINDDDYDEHWSSLYVPNPVVSITQTQNLSTTDPETETQILDELPPLLGLHQ